MQESGIIEVIPFICVSTIWGQHPAFLQRYSSLLEFPWVVITDDYDILKFLECGVVQLVGMAQKFTFGGLELWMAVTLLAHHMAGNISFYGS